jgi:CSLREA domain-containing protein
MKNSCGLTSKLSPFALRFLNCLLVLTLILPWLVGVGHAAAPVAQDDTCPQGYICVNTPLDEKKGNDGLCSLREAIIAANTDKKEGGKPGECRAGNGPDTIILPAGTYTLTRTDNGNEDASQTGDLDITGDLTIVGGPGATIDASGITDRVFHILGGNVTISGVAIKNGGSNVGDGGGIYNGGTLTLNNSTVSGNVASAGGGGIYNSGTLALNNVTIANNTANNGGGILNDVGTVEFRNTIIAGNTAVSAPNCSDTLSSLGYNLVQDTSGCTITGDTTGNIIGQDPLLGPLQNNGGKTETHALLLGSPAIDAGNPAGCFGSDGLLTTDQRGEVRPLDGDDDRQAVCDIGAFEFRQNNFVLLRAFPTGDDTTTVVGLLNGTPNTTVNNLYFSHIPSCDVQGEQFGDPVQVTTDENGYFMAVVHGTVPDPADSTNFFLTATATDLDGNPLGFSNCVSVGENVVWPLALSLDSLFSSAAEIDQYLDQPGQSRWYKLTVEPDSTVIVTLSNLVTNYDLTIYKDIGAAYAALQAPDAPEDEDLAHLGTEFAPDSFSPDSFSPDSFSPDSFSPDSFSPDSFSPDSFSPDSFSPDSFSPDSFSPDSFSPDSFSPDSFSPDSFSPDSFSPDSFSPDSFSPDSFSPDSFSSAQARSLLGVSAFDGTAGEGILVNTWNNTGHFYVRVRGRNGAFSLAQPFHLEVTFLKGACGQVSSNLPPTSHLATAWDYQTIILTDLDRMAGTDAEKSALQAKLAALASEVQGVVVDVSTDARVAAANAQADSHVTCPYAKNLVAQAIKDIVDDYWALNPNLAYVVIAGNDDVVPFFRHPDNALLAPESQYFPPVRDNTPSQASLKLDYVLSQDAYGSKFDISLNNSTYPIPELAVGRLVETAAEINVVLEAFLNGTTGGVVPEPTRALATGYDFLADAAQGIRDQFEDGLSSTAIVDELIANRDLAPAEGWTAEQLGQKLLDADELDLVFLAGHFSANSALAADYSTRLVTADLIASTVNLENAIIFSAGCHSGYNIVNQHDVPYVTREPDWAQAFASKGATLIAGTGYQYGDTDFLEYSERIYLEFSKQLRVGSGPVSIGKALIAAKQTYLAQTPVIRGLHEKALLEATIFGLPMLSVDLPGRLPADGYPRINPEIHSFSTNPGAILGLQYADVPVESPLDEHPVILKDVTDDSEVPASYLSGTDGGVVTNPAEPALPLEVRNVTVDNTVLRGVGFRRGTYTEEDVVPVTGAPTTELRGVHAPFLTDYFYPIQLWGVNYFDALVAGGETLLIVTPAQHKISQFPTDPQESTRRKFSDMTFRLYYSNNFETYTGGTQPSTPALAAAPAIIQVSGVPNNGSLTFNARVVGNPAAGIQEVWVTYTDVSCPAGGGTSCEWESLDLDQNPAESTLWTGELDLSTEGITNAADVRYMVQAVNGVGLVSRADNLGKFFIPGVDIEPTVETMLEFQSPPTEGRFGTKATFSAKLTHTDVQPPQPLAEQRVIFRLGPVTRQAVTNENGVAEVELSLLAVPSDYEVRALFSGTTEYMASLTTSDFEILKQDTAFCLIEEDCVLNVSVLPNAEDTGIVATLTDATGRALRERSVFFVVTGSSGSYSVHEITDLFGRASLGPVPLGTGFYDVFVYFSGTRTLKTEAGEELITLADASYNPSDTAGSLTINTPPVAVDDDYSVDEDSALAEPAPGVLTNDTDADGQTLTAALVTGPANGELTLNGDGSFSYTPNADYCGPDTFTYTANDGIDDSNVATVTLTVNPVNDPPVANNNDFSLDENTSATFDVTANDTDVDGNLDPTSANTDCATCSEPSNGTLVNNGDGTFTYTPDENFFGSDSFSYEVCDTNGACETATVTITVNPVNEPPLAYDQSVETDEDTPLDITLTAFDPDGDPLTYIVVSYPSDGTLSGEVPNLTYTPDADFNGDDSFTFQVNDGIDDSNVAMVSITVHPVNDLPLAVDDAYSTGEDMLLSLPAPGVLGNDSDVDGDSLTANLLTGPSYGTLVQNADGSFTYTPNWNFIGVDSYTYQACDPGMLCDEATVDISVEQTVCSGAEPSDKFFWPPDKAFHAVSIELNAAGEVSIQRIYQDEPTGKSEDGRILGPNAAEVRAEREGGGNGRVYHIQFEADDGQGGLCTGVVLVGIVTHDQSGDLDAIDDGPPWFDSITGEQVP